MFQRHTRVRLTAAATALLLVAGAQAQCPDEPTLQNFTGGGTVACPCFASGEEAGAVFVVPPEHFPIEILRVGIGWGSLFGGNPAQVEQAIHIYNGTAPNPGAPIHTTLGPQLTDGAINEFDLEPQPGEIIVDAGPVAVTLEFLTANNGNSFAPTVVHDGNGCLPGRNLIYAIPGGWFDACALGVTGDWVFHLVYRQVNCLSDVPEEYVLGAAAGELHPCYPNPFNPNTTVSYEVRVDGNYRLDVYTADGRRVATLVDGFVPAGRHEVVWQGRDEGGRLVSSGVYFCRMSGRGVSDTERMVLLK